MKDAIFKFVLCLGGAFLWFGSSMAQENQYGPIGKGFGTQEKQIINAQKINNLTITNKYGNIVVDTWDRDSIEINTLISVESTVYETASEVLNFLSIQSAKNQGNLIYRTEISPDFFSNNPFKIEYTIKVPSRLNLKISNELGDVLVQGLDGKLVLDLAYGKLHLINSQNKATHQLRLNFSDARVDSCRAIAGKMSNCTLNTSTVGSLDFISEYSTLNLDQSGSINLKSTTDRIFIETGDSVSIKGHHLLVDCNQLLTFGFFEIEKGQLNLNASATLSQLTIANDMANTNLTLPKAYSYILNGEVSYGQLVHPEIHQLQLIKDNNKLAFSGVINANGHEGQLILFNENSDLLIKTH